MKEILAYFQENWVLWLFGFLNIAATMSYQILLKNIRKDRERNEAIMQGTKVLLRSQLLDLYNIYYEEKGYCPIYVLENIEVLYKNYKLLGGNGTISQLIEKLKKLPVNREEY